MSLYEFANGYSYRVKLFKYWDMMCIGAVVTLFVYTAVYFFILLSRLEKRPLLCFWHKLVSLWSQRSNLISAFVLLSTISVFLSSFSAIKSLIPLIHPFEFDSLFHDLDILLFAGSEPWKIFYSVFDSPLSTMMINIAYNVWFLLLWLTLSYFLIARNAKARMQFLLSWLLCWALLGGVLATLLSSAGPAFLHRLNPEDTRYNELMALLQSHHQWLVANDWLGIWSLGTQEMLWQAYDTGKEMLGSGISSMPSMHVAIATVMALGGWTINRCLGAVLWLYTALIFVGSFVLGWHYAVDGLVSIPLTCLIWYCVGKFLHVTNPSSIPSSLGDYAR
ncbi:hypothetical protein AND4_16210 [Vibrio sp. AND4]|uniref:phosphatase PAP2 family protein n=2 Tax=Vibrio sp. AND4 TaxID=314289 RepID=UPI00015F1556|nr:hypothetical protein AND4_16210 [Vibrio sp. AND4]